MKITISYEQGAARDKETVLIYHHEVHEEHEGEFFFHK